jgi:hypothetical protein
MACKNLHTVVQNMKKRICCANLNGYLQNTWYYWHQIWCLTFVKKHETLIDVKFPKRPFESQKVAAVDGVTRSLRFVRFLFLTFQKYIVVTFEFLLPATWKLILWRVTQSLKITKVICPVDSIICFYSFKFNILLTVIYLTKYGVNN